MTSFTAKQLRFTFTLSNNAVFEGSNSNTLTVAGLRAFVEMQGAGFPSYPEVTLRILGLQQSDMNALTALATLTQGYRKNSITIEANGGDGWSSIFGGQIMTALPDYNDMPAVAFVVHAQMGGFDLLNPASPTGYTGATDVANVVATIAAKMGKAFENNGVTAQLDSPYFAGTLGEQLRSVISQAGVMVYEEPTLIAIAPRGVARNTPVWTLSPATGLIGYPQFGSDGFVTVRALYNPAYRFGGPIDVQGSDIPRSNGRWLIGGIRHNLSSMAPNGPWFSTLTLYRPGSTPPI